MGNSLLHVAAQVNDADRILQLLELGADPSATNSRGDTFQASLFSGSDARLNAAGRKSRQQVRDWLAAHGIAVQSRPERKDRKSVVSGKSVSERYELGGGRPLKKKNTTNNT